MKKQLRTGKRRICVDCGNEKPVESFVDNGKYDNPVCCDCRFVAPCSMSKNDKRGKFRRVYRKHGLPIREVDERS